MQKVRSHIETARVNHLQRLGEEELFITNYFVYLSGNYFSFFICISTLSPIT